MMSGCTFLTGIVAPLCVCVWVCLCDDDDDDDDGGLPQSALKDASLLFSTLPVRCRVAAQKHRTSSVQKMQERRQS